jgi:hypothetical protein
MDHPGGRRLPFDWPESRMPPHIFAKDDPTGFVEAGEKYFLCNEKLPDASSFLEGSGSQKQRIAQYLS